VAFVTGAEVGAPVGATVGVAVGVGDVQPAMTTHATTSAAATMNALVNLLSIISPLHNENASTLLSGAGNYSPISFFLLLITIGFIA
jgi:hypothetical protein